MRAYALAPGDPGVGSLRTEIPLDRALETARDTTPTLVTGALQDLGWFDRVTDMFLGGIATLATPDAAHDLRARGLQHLHEHLAPDAVARLIADLDGRLLRFANPLAVDIVTATAPGLGHRYYIGQRVFVRAQVPYPMLGRVPRPRHGRPPRRSPPADRAAPRPRPHPSRRIGLAVGRARPRDRRQQHRDRRRRRRARRSSPTFAPGDLCLFQSDSLHGSVENHTNETRVSVGVRVLASTHLRYGAGNHWRPYADARLLHSPFASLATVRSRCTPAAFRRWRFRRRWERAQRAAGRADTPSLKR